jgi:AdoMet-dependent heme synthase
MQPLLHLDALWIQVAGTVCNLTCSHCFVPSGPGNRRHDWLDRATVAQHVADGLALGVREVYFTGGEPFLHAEILAILADTLSAAPTTVLTNGTLFTDHRVSRLRQLTEASRYALEIRVSLDGTDAETHDAVRGAGAFANTLSGLLRLERAGLLPIVTITQHQPGDPLGFREHHVERLRAAGLSRPRIKVLPLFRLGREIERGRGYGPDETLAHLAPSEFDASRLPCGSCRAVTSQGVFVCPLLVDEPAAQLGSRLEQALQPVALRHGACLTCWVTGSTCNNT